MDKTKLAVFGALNEEFRKLDDAPQERDNEIRTLTDVELRIAGGGDDIPNW